VEVPATKAVGLVPGRLHVFSTTREWIGERERRGEKVGTARLIVTSNGAGEGDFIGKV
jgi:hypothetical protein